MSANNEDVGQEERRGHARIDDDVILNWRGVQPDEIPEPLTRVDVPIFSRSTQISLLDFETGNLLKFIGQEDALLAEYLNILEQKLDIVADAVVDGQEDLQIHTPRHVNISVSGLAFLSEEKIPLGTLLELKIMLSSVLDGIVAYGRVIYCIHYEGKEPCCYRLGVGFIKMHEADMKQLDRHIKRRQAWARGDAIASLCY